MGSLFKSIFKEEVVPIFYNLSQMIVTEDSFPNAWHEATHRQMMLDIHMLREKSKHTHLRQFAKINSKWTTYLNVK